MMYGSTIFSAIALVMLNSANDNYVLSLIGIISLVFFGTGSVGFLLRLRSKSSGLIIDEQGITDNVSIINYGMIPWSEIEKVQISGNLSGENIVEGITKAVHGKTGEIQNSYLLITLRGREKYFDQLGGLKGMFLNWNSNKFLNNKIAIQTNNLVNGASGVEEALNKYQK